METRRSLINAESICFLIILTGSCFLLLTACGEVHQPNPSPTQPSITSSTPKLPTETTIAILQLQPSPTPNCTDGLHFVADVTIPDNTVVAPGNILDKQWLVQNSGDCNWDARYRLRLISGTALGASPEQALYPARSGSQANIRILFTAPQEAGEYVSEWQAFSANGIPFGESFFIKIDVQP
jgi:hypothetical protein